MELRTEWPITVVKPFHFMPTHPSRASPRCALSKNTVWDQRTNLVAATDTWQCQGTTRSHRIPDKTNPLQNKIQPRRSINTHEHACTGSTSDACSSPLYGNPSPNPSCLQPGLPGGLGFNTHKFIPPAIPCHHYFFTYLLLLPFNLQGGDNLIFLSLYSVHLQTF